MNLTKADVARLGRKALQPRREPAEVLAVFVPGKLVNTKNARLHHMAESRYKRGWRDAVAQALFEAGWHRVLQSPPTPLLPGTKLVVLGGGFDGDVPTSGKAAKRITFFANTHLKLDTDGLQVALAPVRDALIECGVIWGDAPKDGNEFVYEQRIDRARRGVEIRVKLRATPVSESASAGRGAEAT